MNNYFLADDNLRIGINEFLDIFPAELSFLSPSELYNKFNSKFNEEPGFMLIDLSSKNIKSLTGLKELELEKLCRYRTDNKIILNLSNNLIDKVDSIISDISFINYLKLIDMTNNKLNVAHKAMINQYISKLNPTTIIEIEKFEFCPIVDRNLLDYLNSKSNKSRINHLFYNTDTYQQILEYLSNADVARVMDEYFWFSSIDMLDVITTIDIDGETQAEHVRNLAGIESMSNLIKLKVRNSRLYNYQNDRPNKSISSSSLEILDLSGNRHLKFIPDYSICKNLRELDLSNTRVNNITPIRNLVNLQKISIANTDIRTTGKTQPNNIVTDGVFLAGSEFSSSDVTFGSDFSLVNGQPPSSHFFRGETQTAVSLAHSGSFININLNGKIPANIHNRNIRLSFAMASLDESNLIKVTLKDTTNITVASENIQQTLNFNRDDFGDILGAEGGWKQMDNHWLQKDMVFQLNELGGIRIESLSNQLIYISNLSISIDSDQEYDIIDLDQELSKFTELEYLDISNNQLELDIFNIVRSKKLKHLNIASNNFNGIYNLYALPNIEYLDISNLTPYSILPNDAISVFNNSYYLKYFNASNNANGYLYDLSSCVLLTYIGFKNTNLTDIVFNNELNFNYKSLRELTMLDLSNNTLTTIDVDLLMKRINKQCTIDLRGNQLTRSTQSRLSSLNKDGWNILFDKTKVFTMFEDVIYKTN